MISSEHKKIKYKTIKIDDIEIFYRESGNPEKPNILLLHGFPSSSFMFRELIPKLSDDYHLIAPDYPGFGQTKSPKRSSFSYTFENISNIIDKFTEKICLKKYSIYVFDYGAPIGFRLALKHPEKIESIITQNGNVYEEGLGKKWEARKEYWKNPTKELREQFSSAYSLETIKSQYTFGTPENSVSPDGYMLDFAYVSLPERNEIQNDLIFDYQNNVKLYSKFQKYLKERQPPLLAVWGKNDPSFIPNGANAFKKDLPNAEIHFVDSGHFVLESHCDEISQIMKNFLKKNIK